MSASNDYFVSIIIPFYNDNDFFERALRSVYNQTYQNFEIIIVNDNERIRMGSKWPTFTLKVGLGIDGVFKNLSGIYCHLFILRMKPLSLYR